jgi:predicted aconitase with swiveling domain
MDDDNVLGTSDDGHATVQGEQVSIWGDIGRSTAHGCNDESAGAGKSVYNLHSAGRGLIARSTGRGSEVI